MEAETGASLTQMDEFKWQLFAPNSSTFDEASALIEELLRDEKSILENLEFGAIYPATIVEMVETGVMIKLEPGEADALGGFQLFLLNIYQASFYRSINLPFE